MGLVKRSWLIFFFSEQKWCIKWCFITDNFLLDQYCYLRPIYRIHRTILKMYVGCVYIDEMEGWLVIMLILKLKRKKTKVVKQKRERKV